MKFKRFLKEVLGCIESNELDIYTVRSFLDIFCSCLNLKEWDKYFLDIQNVIEKNTKQITIDDFVSNTIIKELESELIRLKG